MPSTVTRSTAEAPPLPSKTPPSAMKQAISSRWGPMQRRNTAPSRATSGPAPKAAMIQGAVAPSRTAATAAAVPETSTACRPIARRSSRPAPRSWAVWIAAAWRTA
ncbi:hypothetical protein SGRIM128S_06364 [Streptomyces griseomycini]